MSQSKDQTPPEERIFTRGFARVLAVQMAFGVSYSTFLLLPKFLRTELEASAAEIGLMAGLSLVGAACLSPVVGAFAGKFDRRWLLGAALLLESAASLAFIFVTEVGPFSYFLRLLQGIAFVLVFNCTATLVADHVPQRKLGQAVGYLGLSMLCTNALAPAVSEPLAATYGWKVVFGLSGVVALFSTLLVTSIDGSREVAPADGTMTRAPPGLGPVYYGALLVGAGIGTMFTFVQPFALAQGATEVGDFFLGYVAAAVIVRGVFGTVPDRLGPTRVAAASLVLYAAVTIATSQMTPELLMPLGAVLGVSHGFIYPALSARGLSLAPPGTRSVFMGWFACAFNTGFAASVLILGPLADKYGFPPIFIGTGLWVATGVLPLVFERRSTPAVIPAH